MGTRDMTREKLCKLIEDTYGAEPEHLWDSYPDYVVYRHDGNKKWFAVFMNIPKGKLGISGDGEIDIVDLKVSPIMAEPYRRETGIYPGYHMNKQNWLSAALDGTASDETIRELLDISWELTKKK